MGPDGYSLHSCLICPTVSSSPAADDPSAPPPATKPFPDLHPEHPSPVLIRATDGKSQDDRKNRIKISTIVQAEELDSFFTKYVEVCKAGMSGLKKRDRSGRKAKVKEKKRRKGTKGNEEQKGEKKT